jgi:hypothetical protein
MDKDGVQRFVDENCARHTVSLMKAMLAKGLPSRTFMLRELDEKLTAVLAGTGRYAEYNEEGRLFVEACIYVELLERMFLIAEDLNSLCYALGGRLSEFPDRLLSARWGWLGQVDEQVLARLLAYGDLQSCDLSPAEREFVLGVRQESIKRIQDVLDAVQRFDRTYRPMFLKRKHGNPLVFGFSPVLLRGERSVMVATPYEKSELSSVKGIIVTSAFYAAWKGFFNLLLTLCTDLLERHVFYVETGGLPISEYSSFARLDDARTSRLQAIIDRVEKPKYRLEIIVNVEATIPPQVLDEHLTLLAHMESVLKAN